MADTETPRTTGTATATADRPVKKGTARKTARKTTSRTPSKRTTGSRPARPVPLRDREVRDLLRTTGYATTSWLHDAVTVATDAERRGASMAAVRTRLEGEFDRTLDRAARTLDRRAADGRKVIERLADDDRVRRVRESAGATRSRLKATLDSATGSTEAAGDAAEAQARVARSQVKGAATTIQRSAKQARSAAKGAVTSVRRIADVSVEAARDAG